jgi:outer membrane protein OmpA-like peptidoglycan-associated protein
MNDFFRKIILRSFFILVALGIFAYIFWPQKIEVPTTETTIPTTTTEAPVYNDAPCFVLYKKDSDEFLSEKNICLDNYINKYKDNFYQKLIVTCRSSGDGNKIDRIGLSNKRTKNFQFMLMTMGVDFNDIEATSLGDNSPRIDVDPNTEEGKMLNRSCELTGIK